MQKVCAHRFVINLAAIMTDTIAYNKVVSSQYTVIGINLLKNGLSNGNVWRFIFNDNLRPSSLFMVEDRIATACGTTHDNRDFIG